MPTFAYPWPDGSVSLCNADTIDDAMILFDNLGAMSRRFIVELESPIVVSIQPTDEGWKLAEEGGVDIVVGEELEETFYPEFRRVMMKDVYEDEPVAPKRDPEVRQREIEEALERDRRRIEREHANAPETLTIIALYPKGLPGQEN